MPLLFAVTLFVSATLLFMVQPMVGKMILPLLGGSPAAWNTCMVFFQALLLLGYLYAHHLTTRLPSRRQVSVHLTVLGVTIAWLVAAAVLSPKGHPVAVFESLAPQGQSYPMFGVLALLAVAIGLPFFVVSTSAPLFQKWFADTGHPAAADPYFLYAASNAGSLISLLGYPLLIEPSLTLASQAWVWAGGFVVLFALAYACGQAVGSPLRPTRNVPKHATAGKGAPPAEPGPTLMNKMRWLGLAFVPSSLMLGVTFHMTTDIASVPLLWVIPLALYLLTFIIAYSSLLPSWYRPVLANLSPVLTLLLVFVLSSGVLSGKHFMALGVHLVVYFFTALLMHSELARSRPKNVDYLTEYYLWMSVGGMLGGVFNALVAPVAFTGAYEYPIAIAIGAMLIPGISDVFDSPSAAASQPAAAPAAGRFGPSWVWDLVIPVLFLGLVAWWTDSAGHWSANKVKAGLEYLGLKLPIVWGEKAIGDWRMVGLMLVYALPCIVCFLFVDRPVRFGLCVAAILGVHYYRAENRGSTLDAERSFFGILKVERSEESGRMWFMYPFPDGVDEPDDVETDRYRIEYKLRLRDPETGETKRLARVTSRDTFLKLSHGTTLHGQQTAAIGAAPLADVLPSFFAALNPWEAAVPLLAQTAFDPKQEPLTYYHRTGPVGHMFHRFRELDPENKTGFAMIGLGTGSVACYARPGEKLTFFEIDPSVIRLVEKPKYFSYVDDARKRGATVDFVLGDARLQLAGQTDRKYGMILVDAFSSDSIPVHLLTKEAVTLYKDRLTEHGLLAIHISNRYIGLEPVVSRLAKECGLVCRLFSDERESEPGKTRSSWVALAKSEADLGDELAPPNFPERAGAVGGGGPYYLADFTVPYDHPWQRMKVYDEVPAWTDDYSDVMRVMRVSEIRKLRRLFGLPVPPTRDD
ncbi:MAG: fused MFS/spermidine synthase [Gemmataceae bacterium]